MHQRWTVASMTVVVAALFGGVPGPARAASPHEVEATALPVTTWRDLAAPSKLTPAEEAQPAAAVLARRFNPAMAFTHRDIWPVPLRYAWADGSNLTARVVDADGRTTKQYEALPHRSLASDDWGDLPTTDPDGNNIQYFVDAPGDDRMDQGVSKWRQRWRAIMNGDPLEHTTPAALEYAPTQHAHLYWFNRDKGLLAVQYWFYYPYNEWINHHEGDWEHVTVILRGPSRLNDAAGWRPVGYLFYFHEFVHEPQQVVRVGGNDPREDHVVVYVGGKSRFLKWSGIQSGGSYPLPGVFPQVGGGITGLRADEDVSSPARFIRPDDFSITMLPEPERVDVGLHPELSWLRLDLFAGQAVMYQNPLALNGMTFGSVPRQPARQGQWNHQWSPLPWQGEPVLNKALALPEGWRGLTGPPQDEEPNLSARKPPRKRQRRP